jgi:hypothetical protein
MMNKKSLLFFTAVLLVFSTSCSSVKFYSDAGLNTVTGLKYYSVKPYLMVEREISGNMAVKASVIYLPDIEKPQYVVFRPGMGSRKADLKFDSGALASFGMASDSEFPAALTALSNLVSKTATAAGELRDIRAPAFASSTPSVTEIYEVVMENGNTSFRKLEFR